MSDELSQCPFCGEIENLSVDTFDCEDREGTPTRAHCGNCGCYGPWEYERDGSQKCVAAWNRRAKPGPATKAMIKLMKKACNTVDCNTLCQFVDTGNYYKIAKAFLAEQGEA